ncbi:MAG TPA: hypothetical protein VFU02_20660 [Polyangiaceae bacterium]|nr:hypothetical protein [Polyangiaceae bacterium]
MIKGQLTLGAPPEPVVEAVAASVVEAAPPLDAPPLLVLVLALPPEAPEPVAVSLLTAVAPPVPLAPVVVTPLTETVAAVLESVLATELAASTPLVAAAVVERPEPPSPPPEDAGPAPFAPSLHAVANPSTASTQNEPSFQGSARFASVAEATADAV